MSIGTHSAVGTAFRVAFAAALAVLLSQPSSAIVIDDFSVGPITVTRTGAMAATAQQAGLDPNHVLGGGRDIVVGQFGLAGQSLTVDTALQELQLTVPAVNDRGYFDLMYGTTAQPLNIDLTADGSDAFLVEFAGPGGHVSLNWLRVSTSSGEGVLGGGNMGTTTTALSDGRILVEYPFSAFSGAPDFTSVDGIRLEFFRLSAFSGPVLRSITTIPEPATAVLVGAAALSQALRRDRRGSPQR
jgi:hypothetical protein